MTKKSLILAGALALATVPMASAKTYEISLHEPARAGHVQLKAGDYMVKVKGTSAVFTEYRPSPYVVAGEPQYGKSFTVPVKIVNAKQKFDRTEVVGAKKGDWEQINQIELGGSHTELEFGD